MCEYFKTDAVLFGFPCNTGYLFKRQKLAARNNPRKALFRSPSDTLRVMQGHLSS